MYIIPRQIAYEMRKFPGNRVRNGDWHTARHLFFCRVTLTLKIPRGSLKSTVFYR